MVIYLRWNELEEEIVINLQVGTSEFISRKMENLRFT